MTPLLWCIIILAIGLGLIFLELFVPSGGALSFFAAVAILTAVIMAYVNCGVVTGTIFMVVGVVLVPVTIGAALKVYPHTPMGRRILAIPPTADEIMPRDEQSRQRQLLKGQIGIAKTPLLPGGTVKLDGKAHPAVCIGEAVDAGEAVLVVRVEPRQLIVRRVEGEVHQATEQQSGDVLSQPIESLGLESLDDTLG